MRAMISGYAPCCTRCIAVSARRRWQSHLDALRPHRNLLLGVHLQQNVASRPSGRALDDGKPTRRLGTVPERHHHEASRLQARRGRLATYRWARCISSGRGHREAAEKRVVATTGVMPLALADNWRLHTCADMPHA